MLRSALIPVTFPSTDTSGGSVLRVEGTILRFTVRLKVMGSIIMHLESTTIDQAGMATNVFFVLFFVRSKNHSFATCTLLEDIDFVLLSQIFSTINNSIENCVSSDHACVGLPGHVLPSCPGNVRPVQLEL